MNKKLYAVMISVFSVILILFLALILSKSLIKDKNNMLEGHTSGLIAKLSMEEILESSSVIARAVYSGDSKPIRIQSAVSGSELNFTDHYFTQIEVLRGEITDTKRLAVRLEGGLIAGRNEICDDNPKFEKDKEYILCLYNPGGYYEYNTEDEHYYVTGVNQGVFPLTGAQGSFAEKSSAAIVLDETYKRLDGAVTAKDVSFTAESLKSYLLQYNKEVAVNKNHVRETELENAKANLESGFITESEYNDIVNKTALYGKIVTP